MLAITSLLSLLFLFTAGSAARAQDYGSRSNLGETATTTERAEIEALYQRFIPYIDQARTELTMVRAVALVQDEFGIEPDDWVTRIAPSAFPGRPHTRLDENGRPPKGPAAKLQGPPNVCGGPI